MSYIIKYRILTQLSEAGGTLRRKKNKVLHATKIDKVIGLGGVLSIVKKSFNIYYSRGGQSFLTKF